MVLIGQTGYKPLLLAGVAGFFVFLVISQFLLPSMHFASIVNSTSDLLAQSRHQLGLHGGADDRPLVLYSYFETANARQNAEFFIAHGLHDAADFLFILNGPTDLDSRLPSAPNIRIIRRENKCFDLGGVAEVLQSEDGTLLKRYTRYIIMNASIRGPFLPSWSRDCWTDLYLDRVTHTNKMVGMTYNCVPKAHIQSMIIATDSTGLELMLPALSTCFTTFQEAIAAETTLAQRLWDAGYSTSVMMTAAQTIDYNVSTCTHGDVLWHGQYFGGSIHPYETIFFKANRDISPEILSSLTEWHDKSGYSSYNVCKPR